MLLVAELAMCCARARFQCLMLPFLCSSPGWQYARLVPRSVFGYSKTFDRFSPDSDCSYNETKCPARIVALSAVSYLILRCLMDTHTCCPCSIAITFLAPFATTDSDHTVQNTKEYNPADSCSCNNPADSHAVIVFISIDLFPLSARLLLPFEGSTLRSSW
jgi:hypothetical protein